MFLIKLFDYSSYQFRQRRSKQIKELILSYAEKRRQDHNSKPIEVLDIGGVEEYWRVIGYDFLKSENVRITLLNLYPQSVSRDAFVALQGNGCSLPQFPDKSFDIVHSNSVIEHVGGWNFVRDFSNEVRRLGRSYYVQTPNFWFPIEPHFLTPFIHWLPKPIQVALNLRFDLGFIKRSKDLNQAISCCDSIELLTLPMMQWLFPDAVIKKERFILVKSLIAVKV